MHGEAGRQPNVSLVPFGRPYADRAARRREPGATKDYAVGHGSSGADSWQPRPIAVHAATPPAYVRITAASATAVGAGVSTVHAHNVDGMVGAQPDPRRPMSSFRRLGTVVGSIDRLQDDEIVPGFAYIDEVVDALAAAPARRSHGGRPLGIGSGQSSAIARGAETIVVLTAPPQPRLDGPFWDGDILCATGDVAPDVAEFTLSWTVALRPALRSSLAEWNGEPCSKASNR